MMAQLLILLLSFGSAALLTYAVAQLAMSRDTGGKLRDRLSGADKPGGPQFNRMNQVLSQLGHAAARPFMPDNEEKQVVIRRSLARAGIYTPSGIRTVAAAKVVCLVLGLAIGYVVGAVTDFTFLALSLGGLVGYLLPLFWLKLKTNSNQVALTNGLADALDLMVVCVEAGLTIDSAMQRIGQELAIAHPAISREMGLAHMETRVGLARTESLRNMGQRTGNAALQSLASMLIQAERFGTSIADALRIHSETLRLNRQMAAEEIAGKASVKMSFPLVLCIFPSTFIVLAGPTVLQLMKSSIFQ
ncbi:MAG TPA: type II secretion system F family protein [Tepidisphaeraceae bacterium]|jgi:tight adherence protein C